MRYYQKEAKAESRRQGGEENNKGGGNGHTKKESPAPDGRAQDSWLNLEKNGGDLLSHCHAVPSARTGLTALFGMGRGGTPAL